MIKSLQSRWQQVVAAYFRCPEFLWSRACSRVAPMAVVYAIGLAIWSSPSDFRAGVTPDASASVVSVHWRWLTAPGAPDEAKKQKADVAKQKDGTRSKVCWGRRRVAGRWKLAFIC
jgi:hypothetical protein